MSSKFKPGDKIIVINTLWKDLFSNRMTGTIESVNDRNFYKIQFDQALAYSKPSSHYVTDSEIRKMTKLDKALK